MPGETSKPLHNLYETLKSSNFDLSLYLIFQATKKLTNSSYFTVVNFCTYLSGNVCKSGPLHFGSEKSFPSNFVQESILGHK